MSKTMQQFSLINPDEMEDKIQAETKMKMIQTNITNVQYDMIYYQDKINALMNEINVLENHKEKLNDKYQTELLKLQECENILYR